MRGAGDHPHGPRDQPGRAGTVRGDRGDHRQPQRGPWHTGEHRRRVAALRDDLDPAVEVGIHAHNNLGVAIGNTLAAIDEGAGTVDGCACGLGAGAGNTQTEVLVAALDKLGIRTGIDVLGVMDVAEDLVKPIMDRPQLIDRAALVLGYAGVYSSFLLHAERAAKRFGVPVRDILLECGRLRTVGGQEDIIVDIAAELASQRQPGAAPCRSPGR